MTKPQALALVAAIEARGLPCDVSLRFNGGGLEVWSVRLDTSHVYTGADLTALAAYCANNQLQLSATFSELGVI